MQLAVSCEKASGAQLLKPMVEEHPGARLKRAMRSARISAAEIAEARDVSVQGVHKWIRTGQIATEHFPALAALTKTSIEYLMTGIVRPGDSQVLEPAAPDYAPSPASRDELVIPQLAVSGSMGTGNELVDHVDVVRRLSVSLPDLRKMVNFTAPANLAFITGLGDSMEGTFSDGDVLLIDTGVHEVAIDAVYAFHLNGKLFIKTLQRRRDGNLLMISDNKKYEPELLTKDDELEIKGRVIGAWPFKRL